MGFGNRPADPADLDLERFDDEFAQAPAAESREGVPDGKYEVLVDRVEITTAKSSGNPMLVWTLRILGPRMAGRCLFRRSVITRDGVRWLKQDLHLCGVDLERLSDLPAHLEQLLDVKLEVVKRTKGDSDNVYFNRRIGDTAATAQPAATPAPALPPDEDIPF
jgi:hypothetical protein